MPKVKKNTFYKRVPVCISERAYFLKTTCLMLSFVTNVVYRTKKRSMMSSYQANQNRIILTNTNINKNISSLCKVVL